MAKVWEWSKTEGTSLLVLLALADHADDEGWCYPGVERIAMKCRISARTVQRHMQEIEAIGELRIDLGRGVTTKGGATNRYRITVNRQEASGDKAMSPKSPEESPGLTIPPNPQGGEEALFSPTSSKPKWHLSEGFDEFWAAHPKKLSKDSALKVWKQRQCCRVREEIMLALAIQKTSPQWTKKNGQFIPYPAKWLRAGAWKDETTSEPDKTKTPKTGW